MHREAVDYVVVGSGAGGGTVAARLAESGMRVLLLEAGGDPRNLTGGVRGMPDGNRLPDDYDVPAFHCFASENEALRWDFYVNHYAVPDRQARDWRAGPEGVLYPRAGTLGGCTAHNAMILVCPHHEDWRRIEALTGDASWSPREMQRHFRRLEDCHYRPVQRRLAALGIDRTGHGYDGWLATDKGIPRAALRDDELVDMVLSSVRKIAGERADLGERLRWFLESAADPNDIDRLEDAAEGLCYTPLSTRRGRRVGSRERVLDVARRHPDRLIVELDALATRVVLDASGRAIGVDYLKGERLYRAHAVPNNDPGEPHHIAARREVILAGGAFNTPQLLMLSGIGDPAELGRHGIDLRARLDGVGCNLQDRYEVAVINRMAFDRWESLAGADFAVGDALWRAWDKHGSSLYATNGAGIGVIRRSTPDAPLPDLFCMALLAHFDGYYPGYAAELSRHFNCLTWAVLKAHTANRAGRVRLASADPRDRPRIDFNYLDEGSEGHEADLRGVVEGVKLVRRITEPLRRRGLIAAEEVPGDGVQSDDEIAAYIRDNAWGHHASCSCRIGPKDEGGVLDSRFRVHGVPGLRVVDASVFPRIPGFFIAAAVYMVGEKAAETILEDAKRQPLTEEATNGI
ncbi:GMC family oxidoreductase [Paracoccus sp. MBLB3053]|uniref:GMC family oxidoreductase n=1 Tax=Paracoccus aurantius TaxID=3073814 RepID=A0ABU2HXL9_9RHOB|nr:GMC family oxidoreductase [Paracoccus sp. MBLB3053]MDS9469796.1 GMC family oxidoreductase [Paracoccus sp. MBLB3053]